MRDLRPKGVSVELAGVERKLLFTLNAIDAVQSRFNMPVLDALGKMFEPNEQNKAVRDILYLLLEDETEREKYFNPENAPAPVTDQEVGWMVNTLNRDEISMKIIQAYGLSIPEAEEEDPNRESGQG